MNGRREEEEKGRGIREGEGIARRAEQERLSEGRGWRKDVG